MAARREYTVTRTADDSEELAHAYERLSVDPASFIARPPVPRSASSSSVSSLAAAVAASVQVSGQVRSPISAPAPATSTSSPYSPHASQPFPTAASPHASQPFPTPASPPAYQQLQSLPHVYQQPPTPTTPAHPCNAAAGPSSAPSSGASLGASSGASSVPATVYSAFGRVDSQVRAPPRRPLPSTPTSPASVAGPASPASPAGPTSPAGVASLWSSSSAEGPLTPLTPLTPTRRAVPLPSAGPALPGPPVPPKDGAWGEPHEREGSVPATTTTTPGQTRPRTSVASTSSGTCESTLAEGGPEGGGDPKPGRPWTPTSGGSAASVSAASGASRQLPRTAGPLRADRAWLKRVFHKPSAADVAALVLQGWPESDARRALARCETPARAVEYLAQRRVRAYSAATLIQDGYSPRAVREAVARYPNADVANAFLMHRAHCDLGRFRPVQGCVWCDAIVERRRADLADSRVIGAGMGAPIGFGFGY